MSSKLIVRTLQFAIVVSLVKLSLFAQPVFAANGYLPYKKAMSAIERQYRKGYQISSFDCKPDPEPRFGNNLRVLVKVKYSNKKTHGKDRSRPVLLVVPVANSQTSGTFSAILHQSENRRVKVLKRQLVRTKTWSGPKTYACELLQFLGN